MERYYSSIKRGERVGMLKDITQKPKYNGQICVGGVGFLTFHHKWSL